MGKYDRSRCRSRTAGMGALKASCPHLSSNRGCAQRIDLDGREDSILTMRQKEEKALFGLNSMMMEEEAI